MAHDLNADERSAYLKRAIMCRPATLIQARLPNTKVKPKLKKIRQDRRGRTFSQVLGEETNSWRAARAVFEFSIPSQILSDGRWAKHVGKKLLRQIVI